MDIPLPEAAKILVLGASGMLGNALLRYFSAHSRHQVFGSVRSEGARALLPAALREKIIVGTDVENMDSLIRLLNTVRPTVVINCIGVVKQLGEAKDPLVAVPLNTLLPHRLARLAETVGARLIHMSTDCVFSGTRGGYLESDFADADDLYGRSKLLGEVAYPNAITLRTSIIGIELAGARSLVSWFLAQTGPVRGFTKAIFSGLPTNEIARIIDKHVLDDAAMSGLYHVSADPIDKHSLLSMVAKAYGKNIEIEADPSLAIDRSLDSTRFRNRTGYSPAPWPELIAAMRQANED